MEERTVQGPGEAPPRSGSERFPPGGPGNANVFDDPRSLTILTTEHWSLLSGRSLVYNEAFTRASMFLTFLSASLVALALVSTATGFGPEFLLFSTATLGLDLFIALATLGRVNAVSNDDLRHIAAMNRIRHAYLEIQPSLDVYVASGHHDDLRGIMLGTYGDLETPDTSLGDVAHALTTTPGMIGTIASAVGGAFAVSLLLLLGVGAAAAGIGGIAAFVLLFVAISSYAIRSFHRLHDRLDVRFPSPPAAPRRD